MDNETHKPKRKKKWLPYVLHAAVLGGMAYAGMKYVDGEALTKALRGFAWGYAPLIGLCTLIYVFIKGWRFAGMMREVVPEVSRGTVMRAWYAGQAATLLPGGTAARAGMLAEVGVAPEKTAAPLLLSAWSDHALFLLCAITGALFIPSVRPAVGYLLAFLAVVAVVLGVEASRTWLLRIVEKLMGRLNLAEQWSNFRESFTQTATPKALLSAVGNTAVSFVFMVLALWLSLRGVGANDVPLSTVLFAWALPTMLGRVSALPGGVGVTEAGMVGILANTGGASLDKDTATAAVLIFRLGTVVFAAIAGGVVYFTAWRSAKHKTKSPETKSGKVVTA